MKLRFIIAGFACLNASLAQAETYICESEMMAGYKFQGSWVVNQGTYDFAKFLVNVENGIVSFSAFGGKSAPMFAEKDCSSGADVIQCDNFLGQFKFSRGSRRYLESYTLGYWGGVDNNADMPGIVIGNCAAM